jgi:hypothetical protein
MFNQPLPPTSHPQLVAKAQRSCALAESTIVDGEHQNRNGGLAGSAMVRFSAAMEIQHNRRARLAAATTGRELLTRSDCSDGKIDFPYGLGRARIPAAGSRTGRKRNALHFDAAQPPMATARSANVAAQYGYDGRSMGNGRSRECDELPKADTP